MSNRPTVAFAQAKSLPSHDRYQVQRAGGKPVDLSTLSIAQRLVLENKQAMQNQVRRRNTNEVRKALETTPVEMNAQIWIPHHENVWQIVQVVGYAPEAANVKEDEKKMQLLVTHMDGKQSIVDMRDVGDLYRVNPRVVDDMTSLYYIHEAGILENLNARSNPSHLRPYTFMANVLIAVNPLVRTVEPKIVDYVKTQMGDRPPHPYAIAEVAFQQMGLRTPAQDQSIVISGESGAGKTETSKIVLRYLSSREHLDPTLNVTGAQVSQDIATELDKRLWDTNPILEAFGNAKTLRNHNSSRFGKFMKLQFENGTRLCGGFIETYLLERFRVVTQIPGERNFHIFYFLLAGASDSIKKSLHLTKAMDYTYLNQSGCISDPNIDDELLFDEVASALDSVDINAEKQYEVWGILAGLLHLGNVHLKTLETDEGDACEVVSTSLEALELCAKLLGVSTISLQRVIREREIHTRGETFTIQRSAKEGGYVRDAIAKSIYNQLFEWILLKINSALGAKAATLPFIGVLDIFGFESFDVNDFEQLLINYANEALQATFNQQVFIAEQELFAAEGIEVGTITWPDNRECIELISTKPTGILPLLDAEARTPKPSDEKWNVTLHKTHANHPHFLAPHEKDKKYIFVVKHFATRVEYTVGNFIDKNNDTIPKDLQDFVMTSTSKLINTIFAPKFADASDAFDSTGRPGPKKPSVSSTFCDQMQGLVNTLNATRCNFIRCVKPNPTMTPGIFDNGYVVDQLRCSGMLATCELLKVGLPTRVSYEEICRIYKPVLPTSVVPLFNQYNDRTFTEAVLWSFRVDPDAYRLGRTKVFFKTGKISLLDALLKIDMKKMGPWIVSRLRKWLARRRWRYAVAKIIAQKAFLWLLELMRKRQAAVLKMQAMVRMIAMRKKFLKYRNAHRNALRRKALARRRWRTAIKFVDCYNAFKKLLDKTRLKMATIQAKKVAAAISIQSVVRGHLGRKLALRLKVKRDEALLRKRLEMEAAALQLEKKATAKKRWRAAFYTVVAQQRFVKRLHHIRKTRLAMEEAKRLAAEKEAHLRKLAEEERQRQLEAEAQERERQHALALKKMNAAIVIQRAFRRMAAKEEALQRIAYLKAQQASLAAAAAAKEAANAADLANRAHELEADALRRLGALDDSSRRSAKLMPAATLGMAATLGSVQPLQASVGTAGDLSAMGTMGIAGAMGNNDMLKNGEMAWIAQDVGKIEGIDVAGAQLRKEQLAQAGRDIFGEGGELPQGPLLSADDEHLADHIERNQDFPTGPPIPFKGGILTCTMLGHRKQQDENWGDEYTEYVLRVTWGRDILNKSQTAWLVGGRYNDFNALHQELKAVASGRRGKRAPWFPRFPKRHVFSSMIGKNQKETFIAKREKELNRYMTQVLTQMPDALINIHLDRFLNLTLRTQDICEREAYAEAKKRWEEEEREAMANAAEAEPLNEAELQEVERLVSELLQKISCASGDIRQDTELQEMIHAVKVLQPRVSASAQIGMANVNMELIPLAMQLQDDIQDGFNQYTDALLAHRLGQDLN